jgi:glyoxylase-like metal-dependent hydrolase (beta-lactamase superfamily II)
MLQIKEIINSIFTSKTYILYKKGELKAWLVDIGDIEPVVSFTEEKGLTVAGVFITHGHFDHIYGLQSLIERYSYCKVYTTDFGKKSLASDKLNMSRYHECPITYEGDNVIVVHEGEKLQLFEGESPMHFYETPGHNPGCLTMVVDDLIFTGDAYIPGVGANTQLPHANKEQAQQSMERILNLAGGKNILAGHHIELTN